MCFKTAKLADGMRQITSKKHHASVLVNKAENSVRGAIIKFGTESKDSSFEHGIGGGDHSQYVAPEDLRELAVEFNKLADELEA